MARPFLLLLLLLNLNLGIAEGVDRPNIVLIMADDLGFSDLGCYGSEIETPNLDRLAQEGIRFRQFYNTAKCATSRASLLSGRYYPEATFTGPYKNSRTVAETLREAGYATLMTGKWHLTGELTEHGFDRYFGHLSGACNFFKGDDTFRLDRKAFLVPDSDFYTTEANTDFAIRFLQESAPKDKPFFLYLAYNAPHYPLHAKKEDVEKYRGVYSVGWDEIRKQRFERMIDMGVIASGSELSPRPDKVSAWSDLSAVERREHELTMAAYAGMIDSLDQNIGRLIDHLKRQGRFENTVFLFLSDNGACPFQRTKAETREKFLMPWDPESYWTYDEGWAHVGNTPFRLFKQNQHEGGISSPLIVSYPGYHDDEGSWSDGVGHIIDIAPTLYEISGASYMSEEASVDGIGPLSGMSLLPLIRGDHFEERGPLWQFFRRNKAVRQGNWKAVMERTTKRWELYDVSKDRSELHDLASVYPEKLAELISLYQRLDREIKARSQPEKAIDGQP